MGATRLHEVAVQHIAKSIAADHANRKHVLTGEEFGRKLTVQQFAELIHTAIIDATKKKALRRGRTAYYSPEEVIVIHDPYHGDLGTTLCLCERGTTVQRIKVIACRL